MLFVKLTQNANSLQNKCLKCCIGVQDATKFLVKSDTEYTSPIESIMRIKEEGAYLVVTENSLYIVSMDIPVKKIVSGEKNKTS